MGDFSVRKIRRPAFNLRGENLSTRTGFGVQNNFGANSVITVVLNSSGGTGSTGSLVTSYKQPPKLTYKRVTITKNGDNNILLCSFEFWQ